MLNENARVGWPGSATEKPGGLGSAGIPMPGGPGIAKAKLSAGNAHALTASP
jgi:hypothetical protein